MRYAYRAQASDGRLIQGELDGRDRDDVVGQLARSGAVPVSLTKVGGDSGSLFGRTLAPARLTSLLGELAVMLRSGLALDEALSMACVGLPVAAASIVKSIRDDLISGSSIAQSLQQYPRIFPADLIAMTRVGEATGDLHVVFAAVAAERERAHQLAEKVRHAVSYPAFLIVAALSVLLFFLTHVIPQFAPLFDDASSDPGSLLRALLATSRFLSANETLLFSGIGVTSGAALLVWRNDSARARLARLMLKLPLVGSIWAQWRTSRFLASLSLLLRQGIGADEALKILRDSIGMDAAVPLSAASDALRRGVRLSEALAATRLFDSFVERMLKIGEETGELPKLAAEAAGLYARKLERRLDMTTAVIGPAAILVIALLVGGLMTIIMSALMSVDQAVF